MRREKRVGGHVPGLSTSPAFTVLQSRPTPIPIVIGAPHGGRAYPPALLKEMRDPAFSTIRLEDRYVDKLAIKVGEQTGATVIVAHAPRAMIDLNRALEETDWTMLDRASAGPEWAGRKIGRRARGGLGLVPRRLPGLGDIWKRPLAREELDRRIEGVHRPYHQALGAQLETIRERWGAALLIDLHSMPPLTSTSGPAAQFVVGDRFGASCDSGLIAPALGYFAETGRLAVHNRPYAGGFILDSHGQPRRNIHAMQVEVCRQAYLDDMMCEPGAGFDPVVDLLTGLVRNMADEVARAGNAEWHRAAAE